MNQDRELLELAARAAGIEIDAIDAIHDPSDWLNWNPLQDDGDCARMEAALGINVKWFADLGAVNSWVEGLAIEPEHASANEYYADHSGDKQAARRMASLQVAAAIQQAKEAA